MANKRVVATITAVATSAALLLGGTMAWQSISQTALNEASAVVNPGGRLHDDFNGENKDIYVENFADEEIFARIRLDEYFDIRMDDSDGDGTPDIIDIITETGTKLDDAGNIITPVWNDPSTFATHYFHKANEADPYWEWITGGQTAYMPTFNKNKDSLRADINGTLKGPDGKYPWETVPATGELSEDEYDDYTAYSVGDIATDDEWYDRDSNDVEEFETDTNDDYVLDAFGNKIPLNDPDHVRVEEDTEHTAKNTGTGMLISMEEWKALPANMQIGPYWVYDADGWVYWAQPIQPDTATGLLLDGIELRTVMDDGWYYAINAVGQFITADDLGKGTATGFYDPNGGPEPSADALVLLNTIGVDTSSVVSTAPVDPNATEEEKAAASAAAAAELQKALDEGGEISLDGTVTTDTANKPAEGINFDAGFNWTEGGELSGGVIETTNADAYAGLFINAETNWPEAGDSAAPAVLKDTTVKSNADFAVYIQAIDADVSLDGVTVNGANGGVYAEHKSGIVTLNDVNVLARSGHSTDWVNCAVSAANNANVVINSGSYTGKYALYVFSSGGSITINDGYFNGDIRLDGDNNTSGGHAEIIINGGYFNLEKFEIGGEISNFIIKGGTFTADPSAYVTGSFTVVDNQDGTWTVQPA